MNRFFQGFSRRNDNGRGREEGIGWPSMGDLEDMMIRHAQAASMGHQETVEEPKGAPPASQKAIRQLPTVIVAPEDLVDENNRECCICFEPNSLKDRVTRLPCAHIYHHECIKGWLTRHCTCPVCRYELPTDDSAYERTRVERMKHRKPRYARYELERMSISELRALGELCKVSRSLKEKKDIIQACVESSRIDIIAAPEPVQYRASDLKQMGVGKLKKEMSLCGVFFDPIDVVEKDDMIRIFISSGRVDVLEEEITDATEGTEPENVIMESEGEGSMDLDGSQHRKRKAQEETAPDVTNVDSPEQQEEQDTMEVESETNETIGNSVVEMDAEEESLPANCESGQSSTEHGGVSSEQSFPSSSPSQARGFASRSIHELRNLARELRVDVSDCIEKREMVQRLADASGSFSNRL